MSRCSKTLVELGILETGLVLQGNATCTSTKDVPNFASNFIQKKANLLQINNIQVSDPAMIAQAITLDRHLWQQQMLLKTTVELSILLGQIGYVAKIMSREISRAALVGQLGLVGEKNATGDAQKKLDVFSNQTVIEAFSDTGLVAALVSEELDEPQYLDCRNSTPYILCIDPLDGSSNVDSAGALGTIFGVYRRVTQQQFSL